MGAMIDSQRGDTPAPEGSRVPTLGFNAPNARVPGFEILDLQDFRRRRGRDRDPKAVHRADFHTITLITGGRGEHTVDFVRYPCRPGTLLWVRPGQVQQFDVEATTIGPHLLFTADFPVPTSSGAGFVDAWYRTTCWQLQDDLSYARVTSLIAQLESEFDRQDSAPAPEILRLLLAALLLHIDRILGQEEERGRTDAGEVYRRFRSELERSFMETRRVEDLADRLGYSPRTLTRACQAATGQSAKEVIDARVLLEAKRLLAHTDQPIALIGSRLGFTEPTNFGKFFRIREGVRPGEFRAANGARTR